MFNRMTMSAMQRSSYLFPQRNFSRCSTNPVVFMNVSRNGQDLGRMEFEVSTSQIILFFF
jgi:hypothetical protein